MRSYIESLKEKSELKVMMVCLGNICRSPMAAAVLANRTQKIELPKFVVSSSGTGGRHVGEGPNLKSKAVWEESGYRYSHTVQQFNREMFAQQDLILVMDKSNFENVLKLSNNSADHKKVYFLRQFDPTLSHLNPEQNYSELEVPDPYYEPIEAYRKVLTMVESSVSGLISALVDGK